jgi:hypothetical protein
VISYRDEVAPDPISTRRITPTSRSVFIVLIADLRETPNAFASRLCERLNCLLAFACLQQTINASP